MRRAGVLAAAVLVAGTGLLAGCATQVAPDDPVYQKLDALQKRVDRLQQVAGGQGLMSMASEQQQMQQELASLQGQLQDLEHQLALSQTREQAVDKDFDRRLAALEQGASAAGIKLGATAPAGAASSPTPSAQSAAAAPAPAAAPPSDAQAYQAAFDKLRAGNYSAALSAFDAFIKQYPDSRLVSNAWYWMGETHYVNGEYQAAIRDYQQVLTKYSGSAKAPEAYLRIGYAQKALKDYKDARATFKAVIARYSGTTAADLAKKQLQKMDQQGQ